MRIALAGNPNSGKTTMYNALTGAGEKVGNWAGVTVEKKEHPIKKRFVGKNDVIAVDLPGAYSMSPFTSEESVTSEYIQNEKPDVIINIVDATNLSRSLFFTTQLLELGIPVVVALNKTDLNEKRENEINVVLLSEKLHCPVIETVSSSERGLLAVMEAACSAAGKGQRAPYGQGSVNLVDRAAVAAADRRRFDFVKSIVSDVEIRKTQANDIQIGDRIDAVLTNRWLGIPIFAAVMFVVFWLSQAGPGIWIAEGLEFSNGFAIPGLVTLIEKFSELIASLLEGANPLLTSIIVDGIIGGVGAVVGFLPLVMVMYFLIALLEDCGYMARATVVLDPIFKKVGLSGKSVIPFIIGTGCAVPGVMACRTIRGERERRATAMLAPFMPCGAKLPVISLFAGAFFGESEWVGVTMYFLGILIVLFCALLVNKLTGSKRKSYFIMELPEYKAPNLKIALASMCRRGWSFIVKAGTVILVCNFVVHLMQTFGWDFQPVSEASRSILATVAAPFAFILAPIVGRVDWRLAAAAITGFIAKENVVGTLAVCFGLDNFAGADVAGILSMPVAAALAFLLFNLFSPPCFAAIGAMGAEMGSKKWLFAGIGLQLSVGYSLGFLAYFFGTLLTGAGFFSLWIPILGWSIVLLITAVITVLILRKEREMPRTSKKEPVLLGKES